MKLTLCRNGVNTKIDLKSENVGRVKLNKQTGKITKQVILSQLLLRRLKPKHQITRVNENERTNATRMFVC